MRIILLDFLFISDFRTSTFIKCWRLIYVFSSFLYLKGFHDITGNLTQPIHPLLLDSRHQAFGKMSFFIFLLLYYLSEQNQQGCRLETTLENREFKNPLSCNNVHSADQKH